MDLFTYLMAKKGHNTHRDLFSYLLGKNAGGSGTYTTFSGISLNISNTLKAKIKNIALEGNTTQDGTPTPDTPIPIKVVTGEQNIEIKNKNLLKLLNINSTFSGVQVTVNSDKSITLNGTCTSNYAINIITNWSLSLENGKTYTLSGCHDLGGVNMLSLELYSNYPTNQYVTDVGKGKSFTLTTDRTYRCYIAIKAGQTYDNVTLYPMVEEGSQATEYVPYQLQTYPLSLGNIELAKIGDYKDYIFKNVVGSPYYNADLEEDSWYKYNACRKFNITSNLSFSNDTSHERFSLTITRFNISERQDMKSNRYICGDSVNAGFFGSNSDGRTIYFHYPTEETNTIALFKDWLDNNNLYILYVLETPTYEKITDTTLITQLENINNNARSYKDTTIIECTSESEDNETIGFSGDIKVTSVGLGNSLNTSLLSSNIQEQPNLDDVNEIEETSLDDTDEIEETLSIENEIKDEVSE